MGRKLSREEFLSLAEELFQDGPKVKYQNPDAWLTYLFVKKMRELKNKK